MKWTKNDKPLAFRQPPGCFWFCLVSSKKTRAGWYTRWLVQKVVWLKPCLGRNWFVQKLVGASMQKQSCVRNVLCMFVCKLVGAKIVSPKITVWVRECLCAVSSRNSFDFSLTLFLPIFLSNLFNFLNFIYFLSEEFAPFFLVPFGMRGYFLKLVFG